MSDREKRARQIENGTGTKGPRQQSQVGHNETRMSISNAMVVSLVQLWSHDSVATVPPLVALCVSWCGHGEPTKAFIQ